MSNLLNASSTLVRIVEPEAARLLARDPGLARRLKRAAERTEDALMDAACELGRAREAHLKEARSSLHELRGCLQVARDGRYRASASADEALSLAQNLIDELTARARSA